MTDNMKEQSENNLYTFKTGLKAQFVWVKSNQLTVSRQSTAYHDIVLWRFRNKEFGKKPF